MRTYLFLLIIILGLTHYSCDKIDCPYVEDDQVSDSGIVWDDSVTAESNKGVRYVLMEEYTGHKCRNCPEGTAEIENLIDQFGKKFIAIAIHAVDVFANPSTPSGAPAGSFLTDHRTPEGKEYEIAFDISTLPGGTVSRRNFPIVTKGVWGPEAQDIYDNPGATVANLLLTSYYDDSTNNFRVRAIIEWLEEYNGGLNLQVQLVEDSVQDWQQDIRLVPPIDAQWDDDYWHRHMFRGSLNTTWGTSLTDARAANARDTFNFVQAFDPNNVGFNLDHMSVIVFLYKDAPDYEVMQVNEVYLKSK